MSLYLPQFVCFSSLPHPFICAAAALEQQTEPNNNNSLVAGEDPPGHDHNQAPLASVWPPWACLSNWAEITNPPALLTLLSWMSKYLWAPISISELQSHMGEKRTTGVRRCLERIQTLKKNVALIIETLKPDCCFWLKASNYSRIIALLMSAFDLSFGTETTFRVMYVT